VGPHGLSSSKLKMNDLDQDTWRGEFQNEARVNKCDAWKRVR